MSFQKTGKTLPIKITDKMVACMIAAALRTAHKNDSSAIKKIARATGVNLHTVKKWYEAKSAPRASHLLMLAVCYPEIEERITTYIKPSTLPDNSLF